MSVEYKGYKIEGDGKFGYKHIKPKGKGSVPKELRGSFTTSDFAEKAINSHLSKKAVSNGTAKSTD